MLLRPELRALRSDDTPQRLAQAEAYRARDAWLALPETTELNADLAAFSAGCAMAECPSLAALFDEENGAAAQLVESFIAAMCGALDRAPLAHVPLRHFTDGTVSTLLMARSGRTSLLLVAIDGAALAQRPAPRSIGFAPIESWERVLAGSADAELVEARGAGQGRVSFHRRDAALHAGRVIIREGNRQTLLLHRVAGRLVSLKLQRRHARPAPAREYDLASGALLHQSAGQVRESRHELMIALLGRMGRRDAAPVLAEMAQEPGAEALRWEALRECLGLDSMAGARALAAIAADPADPLGPPAAAMRGQLLETYPELSGV